MIKPSTAKLILKRYKETGEHFVKKMANYAANRPNTAHIEHQNSSLIEG